jgi:hypothetical protein
MYIQLQNINCPEYYIWTGDNRLTHTFSIQ